MHSTEREQHILDLLKQKGFVSFRQLDREIDASPATLRRDLERLSQDGLIQRVRGGAKLPEGATNGSEQTRLMGVPFVDNVARCVAEKRAIGRAAADQCVPNEGIMVDGGSTTLQMCPHLKGLNLQVLTNSLHIVGALLQQPGTRVNVPGGAVFPEQNIILAASGDDSMPKFYGPKLFMGAASVGPQGPMQADIILVAAERRLIERADEVILLVDSTKFEEPSGNVVCDLGDVTTLITDTGIADAHAQFIEKAGVKLITVEPID